MLFEESYGKLLVEIEPVVVESETDYDRLAAELEKLTDLEEEEGQVEPGRERMIMLLSSLLAQWDDAHHPVPDVSPAQMLQYSLDLKGINKRTLATAIGVDPQLLSNVTAGGRDFSLQLAQKVAHYFGQPYTIYLKNHVKNSAA